MKNKPLFLFTIEEAAAGLAAGTFTSLELTEACLDHATNLDKELNCFVRLEPELARAMAKASDERRAAKTTKGILDGIPYNLKDVYATKDSPTTASSHILNDWIAPYNATVYHKLNEAGAVLIGKTNTDEFTMGSSTESSYYGVTRNPWDTGRVAGGSSGGPTASIAAHFGIFSVGTDTGGSIRQPAAYCGVTGLRPTYGRVSRFGELAMASSLDQTGPITKNARDAAILLQVLAGQDHLDATSSPEPVPNYLAEITSFTRQDQPLKGIKLGVAKEYFGQGIMTEVEERTRVAIAELEKLGASVQEISLPGVEYALAVYYIIAPAEISSNMSRYDGIHFGYSAEQSKEKVEKIKGLYDVYSQSRAEGFGAEVKRRIMLGTHVLSSGYYDAYYSKAERVREVVAQQYRDAFSQVDALVAPVTPHPAFKVGEKINDPLALYKEDILTVPLNIGGVPGISVPCGLVEGLPVGLQIITDRFQEKLLLRIAAAYQEVTEHHNAIAPILSHLFV